MSKKQVKPFHLHLPKKQQEVLQQLKDLKVPQFEPIEKNINMQKLVKVHKDALLDLENVNAYLKNKAIAYKNSCDQMQGILKEFFFPPQFDPMEQICFHSLASLNHILHLPSLSSNFMLAMTSLEEDYCSAAMSLDAEKQLTVNLVDLTKSIAANLEQLKSVTEHAACESLVQTEELEKEKNQSSFHNEKMKKYHDDLQILEEKLKNIGLDDSLRFSSISRQLEDLSSLEKELAGKKEELSNYSLPPDITLAEIEVKELREKVSKIMKNICESYTNIS